MNFYLHYKNMPYQFKGITKHSETLEELVVYKTRYSNPNGKLWVRPRKMFEENVEIKGELKPRFAKVALEIQNFQQISQSELKSLSVLIKETLGEWDPKWFHSRIEMKNRIYLQIASIASKPVAFKLGYALDDRTFYSWLGGVLPDYRGCGIAGDLMTAQHDWCRSQGFAVVETKSQNRWRNQLLLNLKHGFEITGYHDSNEGGPKIMFSKNLNLESK